MFVVGGIFGVIVVLSCCVILFVLFIVGIGGVWISNFIVFELY